MSGGRCGIRTHDTLSTYTPLAGERLQPLGQPSYLLASTTGLEPVTYGLEDRCSNPTELSREVISLSLETNL